MPDQSIEPARVLPLLPALDGDKIDQLIAEGAEETLHLEFKTLADASGERLTKEDRKLLARAICGMANADGGLVVIGLETKRSDNIDVVTGAKPIGNPDKMRNLLTAAIPEMLSPQHLQVRSYSIKRGDEGRGFIVIEVPRSDSRPHYSNVHHQYFRRGSDGTRVLEHSEIRELMFTVREAMLDINYAIRGNVSAGLQFGIALVLNLRNNGRVPAVAPYIRTSSRDSWKPGRQVEHLSSRHSTTGERGIYGTRDLLVHVDDEIGIAEIDTGLDFRGTGQRNLDLAMEFVRREGPNAFRVVPFLEMGPGGAEDRPILISGIYGAENVAARKFSFDIGKMDLFELFRRSLRV
jgi:Schlafen, AlbA_2